MLCYCNPRAQPPSPLFHFPTIFPPFPPIFPHFPPFLPIFTHFYPFSPISPPFFQLSPFFHAVFPAGDSGIGRRRSLVPASVASWAMPTDRLLLATCLYSVHPVPWPPPFPTFQSPTETCGARLPGFSWDARLTLPLGVRQHLEDAVSLLLEWKGRNLFITTPRSKLYTDASDVGRGATIDEIGSTTGSVMPLMTYD